MIYKTYTVVFEGVEARCIEVQCALSAGLPGFSIVGLPNKAVSEARHRVRSALASMSIALPSKRITVNLSPADLPKDGSHFDLPIALALMAAIGVIAQDACENTVSLGELSLDGTLVPVRGALPAAVTAAGSDRLLICPRACGPEAAWVATAQVIGADSLWDIIQHFNGQKPIPAAQAGDIEAPIILGDLCDIKGQERGKRALEIAVAGRHHLFLVGTPGCGKSMLAKRSLGLLPPLTPTQALETSMIKSIFGELSNGGVSRQPPFRPLHHTTSDKAIIGGGRDAKPGEISLAHNGILFMDEFPEFSRTVLESLRQPLEDRHVMVARANAHSSYRCQFMLIATANPCKCGYLSDPSRACARAPLCGGEYMGHISGPMMDRFDLTVEMPPVPFHDLDLPSDGDTSATVAARVAAAFQIQTDRYRDHPELRSNADLEGAHLNTVATPDRKGHLLLNRAAELFRLSARGYHRVLRVGRTIADLAGANQVTQTHIAEALSYRLALPHLVHTKDSQKKQLDPVLLNPMTETSRI